MEKRKAPQNAGELLEAIEDFVEESDEQIASLSEDQVQARLVADGVNITGRHAEMRKRFQRIEGQERLNRAARQRQAREAERRSPFDPASVPAGDLRQMVQNRLANQKFSQEQRASYFRNFDSLDEDDLRQMLTDLEELDQDDAS